MIKRRLIVLAFLLLSFVPSVHAADRQTIGDMASLQGVKTFNVVIESLNDDVIQDGLTAGELQTDVELRFREVGIPVAVKSGTNQPFLYVRVSTIKVESQEFYSFGVEVIFQQPVTLVNNPKIKLFSSTWETGSIGFASKKEVQTIRHFVADDVDRFINQYFIANPVHVGHSLLPIVHSRISRQPNKT